MSKFDEDLKALLSKEDDAFMADIMDETGYYKTVFNGLICNLTGARFHVKYNGLSS